MSPPQDNREVEAKLLAPDEPTLRSLAKLDRIGRFDLEQTGIGRLHTLYLDTRDRRLLANRVALRVRRSSTGWEMTAKWRGHIDGDVHTREEINAPLASAPTPPYRLADGPLAERLAEVVGESALEPLVATDIERTTALLRDGNGATVAELALDVVECSAPGTAIAAKPHYEVEVEQLSGPTSAIAEISQWLRMEFALEPTRSTKFSRAMAALDNRDTRTRPKETT